jgi:protein arginine kinase activator
MLCQLCQKNESAIELTEIINDETIQLHLCEQCAYKKGIEMEQHFSIADLLAGMGDLAEGVQTREAAAKCPACGMTWYDFGKIGRLGCGECYKAFRQNLLPLLKRIHGSTRHTGKVKAGRICATAKKPGPQELRQKLQRAVEAEEFEEAAKIRDKIRELERKSGSKG